MRTAQWLLLTMVCATPTVVMSDELTDVTAQRNELHKILDATHTWATSLSKPLKEAMLKELSAPVVCMSAEKDGICPPPALGEQSESTTTAIEILQHSASLAESNDYSTGYGNHVLPKSKLDFFSAERKRWTDAWHNIFIGERFFAENEASYSEYYSEHISKYGAETGSRAFFIDKVLGGPFNNTSETTARAACVAAYETYLAQRGSCGGSIGGGAQKWKIAATGSHCEDIVKQKLDMPCEGTIDDPVATNDTFLNARDESRVGKDGNNYTFLVVDIAGGTGQVQKGAWAAGSSGYQWTGERCVMEHAFHLSRCSGCCCPDLLHFEQQAANLNVTSPECAKWFLKAGAAAGVYFGKWRLETMLKVHDKCLCEDAACDEKRQLCNVTV